MTEIKRTWRYPRRKFKNGDRVVAGYYKLDMVVVDAIRGLTFWQYRLGFATKKGFLSKKHNHRFFPENELTEYMKSKQKA